MENFTRDFLLPFFHKNNIKYRIDTNPSKAKIKRIKESIKKWEAKFNYWKQFTIFNKN